MQDSPPTHLSWVGTKHNLAKHETYTVLNLDQYRFILDSPSEIPVSEMRSMLDTNIVALVQCSQLSIKSMIQRNVNDGHIININRSLLHNKREKMLHKFRPG